MGHPHVNTEDLARWEGPKRIIGSRWQKSRAHAYAEGGQMQCK